MSRTSDIKNLITTNERRRQKLEVQKASFGLHTPPYVLTEIEDCETELERLRTELAGMENLSHTEPVSYMPEYPYQEFTNSFRDIVAPKKYTSSNSILNLVFGNISDIREITVTIPINQSFDFRQRGPRSVLASFEKITVGGENFFDTLEKNWPESQRPSQAGIGHAQFLQLPTNSNSLHGVVFAVTTRNLSSSQSHYGRYVNTPVEGIDYILDKVLEKAKENGIHSLALPLLGTGYANVNISFNHPELLLLIQQIVLALTIHKLEGYLTHQDSELKRGIVVVYSSQTQGEIEHRIWDFAIKLLNKDPSKRAEQIQQLIQDFSQKKSELLLK
jgi:hypothetical protein